MQWKWEWNRKQGFEKKLGDLGRKLEDFDGELDDVGASLTESFSELRSLRQELAQESHKVREAVSTGTRALRKENQELLRRQEKMLADLEALHLEIRSALAGARSAPGPAPSEADDEVRGGETGGGEDGEASAETEAEAVADPPPRTPGEAPEDQDEQQSQEGHMEQGGARREPEDSAAHGVPEPEPVTSTTPVDGGDAAAAHVPRRTPASSPAVERTPEEDIRAVKDAAERVAPHHLHGPHGSSGSPGGDATSPRAGGPGLRIPHHKPNWYAQRPEPDQQDPRVAHGKLLLIAARVSRAELLCHRDTWEFLLGQVAGHPRFRVPSVVEDAEDGRVRTALSGPSLIAVLITLWDTRNAPSRTLDADWALAVTLYERVQTELTGVRPGVGHRTARIVLDDGIDQDEPAGTADASEERDEPDAA